MNDNLNIDYIYHKIINHKSNLIIPYYYFMAEFGEYKIGFNSNGYRASISFKDERLPNIAHSEFYYYHPEETIICPIYSDPSSQTISVEKVIYKYENKIVNLTIQFSFIKMKHPKKIKVTKYDEQSSFFGGIISTPVEFEEVAAKTSLEIDETKFYHEFNKNIDNFIVEIRKRIYLNNLFLNSSGYK